MEPKEKIHALILAIRENPMNPNFFATLINVCEDIIFNENNLDEMRRLAHDAVAMGSRYNHAPLPANYMPLIYKLGNSAFMNGIDMTDMLTHYLDHLVSLGYTNENEKGILEEINIFITDYERDDD